MVITLPEPQTEPYANVPNTAIFGQNQGSRHNLPFQTYDVPPTV